MSRIRSSAATSFAAFTVAGAAAENSFATTTSSGRGTFVCAMIRFASSTRSASASDLPIG